MRQLVAAILFAAATPAAAEDVTWLCKTNDANTTYKYRVLGSQMRSGSLNYQVLEDTAVGTIAVYIDRSLVDDMELKVIVLNKFTGRMRVSSVSTMESPLLNELRAGADLRCVRN